MQITPVLSNISDQALRRSIRVLALVLIVGAVGFVAFYTIDRWVVTRPAIIDQEVAALEQSVRTAPNDLAVRGQLADTYVRKGRFADAVTQYDSILATGRGLELAHFGRAAAYMGLGRLDDAATDYQFVIDFAKDGEMANVDTTLEAAYYGLGSIAMKQERPADAITQLQKALAITRSDADALYLIGTAFIATGDSEKAITVLRASVVFVPFGWSEPYVALKDAYTASGKAALADWAQAMADLNGGNADRALTELNALVGGDAGLDAAVGLGLLYEVRGDTAMASSWYAKALVIEPDNNAARLGMTRVGPVATPAATPGSVRRPPRWTPGRSPNRRPWSVAASRRRPRIRTRSGDDDGGSSCSCS